MEVLFYFLVLSLSVLFNSPQPAAGQGVYLQLNNGCVNNFELLQHRDIDTNDDVMTITGLVCRTDNTSCCRGRDNPNGSGFGDWFHPSGFVAAFSFDPMLPPGGIYRQRRLNKAIRLFRDNSRSTNISFTANGLYRCEVADQNGVLQTRYVGLYTEGAGVISISEAPQFSLISEDPLEVTLTSTTTGGPPTTAYWTLPDASIVSAENGLSLRVVNAVNATVEHTLTLTERLTGVYMFSASTGKNGTVRRSITIQAANPPTGLTAVQDSLTSVLVSCTAPASGGASHTGYHIFYQTGGSEQTALATAGATSLRLTGLQIGATYSISIVALSDQLPSARVGPVDVTVSVVSSTDILQGAMSRQTTSGVTLKHKSNTIPNFGIRWHREINSSDYDPNDVGSNLVCRTDNTTCCRGDNGMAQGNWYYPTGGNVLFSYEGPLPSGQIYRFRRGSQVVWLRRDGTASAATANGLYRCEVADQNGVLQTRYVGLYTNRAGLNVTHDQELQIIILSLIPLEFALSCITAGRSPTVIKWTYSTQTETKHIPKNQTFTKVLDAATSTVQHIAILSGPFPGKLNATYMHQMTTLNVDNAIFNASITVNKAEPPTNLTAVQSAPSSIQVSWNAPASDRNNIIAYVIFYNSTDGGNETVDVGADATDHTRNDLENGTTYNISILAVGPLPSTLVGPVNVTLIIPTVTAEVLDSASIRVTFAQPSGSLAADKYDIQYTRVTGAGQTLCASATAEDTGEASDVQSPFTITKLEEFSNYSIAVTASISDTLILYKEHAMTSPSAPAAAPQNLMKTTVLSTSITVGWDPVECIERNGVIHNYTLQFGPECGLQSESTVQSRGIAVAGIYNASGLTPFTRYSFEVAAVNSAGTGPFTATLIVETSALSPPTGLMAVQDGLTSVLVSWTAPASDSSVITGYRITYTSDGGISTQSLTVTGYSTTSHTLSSLESGATYNVTIVSLFDTSSSSVEGPFTVTVREFLAPTVSTLVLGPTSIRVNFSGSLTAEKYDIHVTGAGQILCGSVEDTDNTTDVQSPFIITDLEEFSSYDITVTARAFSAMRATTEQAMTSPAAPAAAPQNLMTTTVLSTSITVGWDPVECMERNGVINNYTVRFGPEGGLQSESTVQSGGIGVAGIYTASTGLTPFTRYSFKVAAVNSAGTGPFTATLTLETEEDAPGSVYSLRSFPRFTAIVLTWNAPQSPNGIITHYEVSYWSTERNGTMQTTPVMFTEFTLSELKLDTRWTFEVAAFTEAGRGVVVIVEATTLTEEDGAQFQLQLSPVEHCTTWSSSRAQQMRRYIHTAIVAAIAKQEVELFESSFLLDGFFRCWHSPTEVTYRSSIIDTGTYDAHRLVAFLQDWVDSRPVVRMEGFELQVLGGGCPVALSSLSAPECSPPSGDSQLPADPTLITRDPAVIECVNVCLFRRGGTVMCT